MLLAVLLAMNCVTGRFTLHVFHCGRWVEPVGVGVEQAVGGKLRAGCSMDPSEHTLQRIRSTHSITDLATAICSCISTADEQVRRGRIAGPARQQAAAGKEVPP